MKGFNWNDFFDDFDRDSQVVTSEVQAISPKVRREQEYTDLVHAYNSYYTSKSKSNIVLRIVFFSLSFFLLAVLIGGCIAIAIVVCLVETDKATILTTLLSSMFCT